MAWNGGSLIHTMRVDLESNGFIESKTTPIHKRYTVSFSMQSRT